MKSEIEWHRVDYFDDGWDSDPPPDVGRVLVTTNWGEVSIDTVVDGEDGLYFDYYEEGVKAWATIPEPYCYDGDSKA